MLCIYPVREKEWKSETKQNQMVNFKMATMTREISRPSFVWRPFTCAPVSSRTFFVVFQLWQPVGNPGAAILIFAIQFYDRKDNLDLNPSGQLQWLTGCKRLWAVFLARPVLNQMAAEMGKCCHLQALSPSNGHVPLDIVFLQFDFYSWFCLEI